MTWIPPQLGRCPRIIRGEVGDGHGHRYVNAPRHGKVLYETDQPGRPLARNSPQRRQGGELIVSGWTSVIISL